MLARRAPAWALVAIACLASGAALAQDPRSGITQKAARDWLAQTDKIDAAGSYAAAGAKFKSEITVDRWLEALQKARAPLGATEQRTTLDTSFENRPDGGPKGEFALFHYRTVFANKPDSVETITLEHEPDGTWRVIGYLIR